MSYSNTETGSKPADPYTNKNKEDPSLAEKIEDLSTFVSSQKFGMMTTRNSQSGALVSRAMAVAGKENSVDLIFHTNTESGKTDDLEADSAINISFINGSGEWASVSGSASILSDRETVKKYYSPALKAWLGDLGDGKHDGGPEDPRIAVIRVKTKTATYAIVRKNIVSRGVEIAQGVVTGESPQIQKLREISEQEVQQWRATQ